MTSLEDKAENDGGPEVILASDAAGVYRLTDYELISHQDIRETGEFPEYGDFTPVTKVRASDGEFVDGEDAYLETPGDLAKQIIESQVAPGELIAVSEPQKSLGGRWSFSVSVPQDVDDLI